MANYFFLDLAFLALLLDFDLFLFWFFWFLLAGLTAGVSPATTGASSSVSFTAWSSKSVSSEVVSSTELKVDPVSNSGANSSSTGSLASISSVLDSLSSLSCPYENGSSKLSFELTKSFASSVSSTVVWPTNSATSESSELVGSSTNELLNPASKVDSVSSSTELTGSSMKSSTSLTVSSELKSGSKLVGSSS